MGVYIYMISTQEIGILLNSYEWQGRIGQDISLENFYVRELGFLQYLAIGQCLLASWKLGILNDKLWS